MSGGNLFLREPHAHASTSLLTLILPLLFSLSYFYFSPRALTSIGPRAHASTSLLALILPLFPALLLPLLTAFFPNWTFQISIYQSTYHGPDHRHGHHK